MTIAACYLSPEGVVLGADSTTTYTFESGTEHHYNHAQKLFEIGNGSTLGAVTWGLGGLAFNSYRRLFSLFADGLTDQSPQSVNEVVDRWIDFFWSEYSGSALIGECKSLNQKKPFESTPTDPADKIRTKEEEDRFQQLLGCWVGFCIGGYVLSDRTPAASMCVFHPLKPKPGATRVPPGSSQFWGAPKIFKRLMHGCDDELRQAILESGKWNGTNQDLDELLKQQRLAHPVIPIRDAIDFVHTCILSTIKALKFSKFSPICGGPVEVAVITADRPFRWVRHKEWDSAIAEGVS